MRVKILVTALLAALTLAGCRDSPVGPAGTAASSSSTFMLPPGAKTIALSGSMENRAMLADFDPSGTTALIGSGYNSVNSTVRARCVDGNQPLQTVLGSTTNPDGQATNYDFRYATSVSQLRKSLSIDANTSFGIGIFSGSQSAHFFESSSINSMTSYMIIDVTVVNQVQTLSRKLMADFAKAKMSKPAAFRAACGNGYIDGIKTGGKFTAVVKFAARSEEYKRDMDIKLAGKVADFASGSISISQMTQSLHSSTSVTIEILRKGSVDSVPTLNELQKYAQGFPQKVHPRDGSPWPIEAIVMDYSVAEDYDGDIKFSYPIAVSQMERLAEARDQALELRNDILLFRSSPDDFGPIDQAKAKQDEQALNSYLSELTQLARQCVDDPDNACTAAIRPIPPITSRIGDGNGGSGGGIVNLSSLEALFEQRGDPAKVDRIVRSLDPATLSQLPIRDRYRALLLLSRVYYWRSTFGYPEGLFIAPQPLPFLPEFMNDDVLRFRKSLADAAATAAKLPSLGTATCELGYLQALDAYMKRPVLSDQALARFDSETPALINRFQGLRELTTIDKKPCTTFDDYGIDRSLSRLYLDMGLRAASRPDGKQVGRNYWLKGIESIRSATFNAPEYPGNPIAFPRIALAFVEFDVPPSYAGEGCSALQKFVVTAPSGRGLGLQPLYGRQQELGRDFIARTPCSRFPGMGQ